MFFYNSIFTFIFPMVFCSSRIRHSSRYAFSLYSSKAEFSERSRAISLSCSSLLASAFAFSSAAWAISSGAGSCLARGYIVELGELGHLSVSLKCTQKVMTKKEIRSESICFDNVHLRTSKNFKLKVRREMRLERVPKSRRTVSKTEIPIEQRLQMLQEFLKKNGGITRK